MSYINKLWMPSLFAILIILGGCAFLNVPRPQQIDKTFDEKLSEVAKMVPEFGGMFHERGYLYVYLLDPAKKAAVEEAIKAVFGSHYIPFDKVQIIQGQYSFLALQEWHRAVREITSISRAIIAGAENRLIIWLEQREAQSQVEQEFDRLGIPREAVLLVVGKAKPTELSIQLEVNESRFGDAESVRYIDLKLKVKNLTSHYLELILGGDPPYDFVVTNRYGMEVWRWPYNGARFIILKQEILRPGGELEFTAAWNQRDNEGYPVPPGTYEVRGLLYAGEPPWEEFILEAEPKSMVLEQ